MVSEQQQNIGPVVRAAEWVELISSGAASQADMQRFQSWLQASPDNEKDYVECCQIWALASAPEFWSQTPQGKSELGGNKTAMHHVVNVVDGKWRRFWRGWMGWTTATLAAVLLLVGVITPIFEVEPVLYQTATSEQRLVVLADGSRVHLNTATELEVLYSGSMRRIELLRGEAFFDVVRDPGRVFEVVAGSGITRVLGTQFTIRSDDPHLTTVTVAQGRVEIVQRDIDEPGAELGIDQQLSYGPQGFMSPIKSVQSSQVNAWRTGTLRFSGDTLSTVVKEINRYSVKKLIVGDESLNNQLISGIYRIGETESFIFGISQTLSIRVAEQGNHIVLLPRHDL